jgi:hypothetical protein
VTGKCQASYQGTNDAASADWSNDVGYFCVISQNSPYKYTGGRGETKFASELTANARLGKTIKWMKWARHAACEAGAFQAKW